MRHPAAAVLAAVPLAAALSLAAPAAQAAWMHTGWETISMSQDACLRIASDAMRDMGFTPSQDRNTTFGWRGQDGAAVRCIADKQLAVLFVYGAATQQAGVEVLEGLRAAYKREAPPPPPPPAPARPPQSQGGSKF